MPDVLVGPIEAARVLATTRWHVRGARHIAEQRLRGAGLPAWLTSTLIPARKLLYGTGQCRPGRATAASMWQGSRAMSHADGHFGPANARVLQRLFWLVLPPIHGLLDHDRGSDALHT